MEILRRTGLDCELVRKHGADPLLRARRPGSPTWTVHAGPCRIGTEPRIAGAFVGPAGSARVRRLREPDERQVAALVMAQALHPDPGRPLTDDTASALGIDGGRGR